MQEDRRPVFLVGFMGSGKSTVGVRLARRLGWEFVDLDTAIERREGRSVEAIFEQSGEAGFRRAELDALGSLAPDTRLVVATGGGLPTSAPARRWLRAHGRTVWLDVPLEVCTQRVGQGKGRPLWPAADPLARRVLFEKRRVAYALAELRIDAATEAAEVLAAGLAGRL